MNEITNKEFLKRLSNGSDLVIKNKEIINAINVFPVPDADTGSNLSKTFEGFKKGIERDDKKNILEILEAGLLSALESSQGNSGIMMTAYLSGLFTNFNNNSTVALDLLKRGFLKGAENARNSVEEPKVGTMLDVMDEFALSFKKNESFVKACEAAYVALVNTESKMNVLFKNHVVDAGALGFVFFIAGFCDWKFDYNMVDISPVKNSKKEDFGRFPFEVVFIANKCSFKASDLRDMFAPLGDSLDIVEIEGKTKLHIHTDEPDLVNQTASLVGEIENIETVDMRKTRGVH